MAHFRPRLTFAAAILLTAGIIAMPLRAPAAEGANAALVAAVAAPTRSPNNVARDQYRHPGETLAFFGVKPSDTVVEIWPGPGWYTEILAPYLKGKGTLYAVDFWPNDVRGMRALQAKDPALYGGIKLAAFPVVAASDPVVPAGTADAVLTFRNVHNWQMGYKRGDVPYAVDAFKQMYAMLKPGGVLGIEDHRLPESADAEREKSSGYIKVSTIRTLAEQAGFVFEGASEVNANPKDKADYTGGVWTLLPGLRGGEQYRAIGESDRMTLRFRKPKT
jgi:predicted methyltransferase